MKHTYFIPQTEVAFMTMSTVLCASGNQNQVLNVPKDLNNVATGDATAAY